MAQNTIKQQLKVWMTRKIPNSSARVIDDLPISIASDIGVLREENQDRAVLLRAQVTPQKSFVVGVLCDGMGGMLDGAACAALAISSFISSCIHNRLLDVNARLLKAVNEANLDVFQEYKGDGGATLSAFIFDSDGNAAAVNVGDSRIYAVVSNNTSQLSTDDTITGQFNRQNATSPLDQKLLQFIGIGNELEIHQIKLPDLASISKLLLTSDGIHYLHHNTFSLLTSRDTTSLELSKRLISVSKWCGGHDNATTIIVSNPSDIFSNSSPMSTGTVKLSDFICDVFFIAVEKNQDSTDANLTVLQATNDNGDERQNLNFSSNSCSSDPKDSMKNTKTQDPTTSNENLNENVVKNNSNDLSKGIDKKSDLLNDLVILPDNETEKNISIKQNNIVDTDPSKNISVKGKQKNSKSTKKERKPSSKSTSSKKTLSLRMDFDD